MLDEPLSALDRATRQATQELLREVNRKTGVTVMHITHNEEEAAALADIRLRLQEDPESGRIWLGTESSA